MCCCSKQPVRGEKTSDPRTGCVGDYALYGRVFITFCQPSISPPRRAPLNVLYYPYIIPTILYNWLCGGECILNISTILLIWNEGACENTVKLKLILDVEVYQGNYKYFDKHALDFLKYWSAFIFRIYHRLGNKVFTQLQNIKEFITISRRIK
jgi:hypothetical protein